MKKYKYIGESNIVLEKGDIVFNEGPKKINDKNTVLFLDYRGDIVPLSINKFQEINILTFNEIIKGNFKEKFEEYIVKELRSISNIGDRYYNDTLINQFYMNTFSIKLGLFLGFLTEEKIPYSLSNVSFEKNVLKKDLDKLKKLNFIENIVKTYNKS